MSELKRYEFDVDWEDYEQSDGRFMLAADVDKHLPKWVSVEDRLPEKAGEWIVARHLNKRPFTCRLISKKGTLGIHSEYLDADNLIRDPTHWMPLPES